ncbi:cytochrome c oxidase subunit 4 [Catellatospora citrea]|uniref:Cytochrome c oxidase polypeptide 4 n=1 Tax=Catellatospora citrea TaxID=53366 RepID=A0A8J3KEH9_9ACTN|nr:cytochrome c oxidase subunit 4 [Catellatospora citrea]RKE07205.1 cytochrome c oxidase subunit IV [Catellatospora citrea]GIF95358.1 cytochrome c oxidase polypeptide 4 [Catellatospora citrea]
MKTEYRIFIGVALFLIVAAVVYGWWTDLSMGGVEWIGTTALVLSFLLCTMCGGYFWFVSRRIDPRPEDRLDAEIADGAGELGFFSPGSYWPFGIAVSALIASLGLVFWMWWLIGLGIVCVLLSTSAMLFEYYTGTRRTAEH